MNVSVAEVKQDATHRFRFAEELESVAGQLPPAAASQAAKLRGMAREVVGSVRAVHTATAAAVLDLSPPTIRSWLHRGVLTLADSGEAGPIMLDPHRVHEVLRIVRELRAAVESGTLVELVWQRLEDRELFDSGELQAGLAAWRRGDVVEASPRC